MEEANKLIGLGKKQLVTGKVVEAVSTLQEACGILAKAYGDTADECGEAFYWCGKALLDLARMENSVLGNALQGVPEEEEDEEKPRDSNVEMESTESLDEKTRDELRVQVYDAMAENDEKKAESTTEKTEDAEDETGDGTSEVTQAGDAKQKEDEDPAAEKSEKDEQSSKTKEEDETSDQPDEKKEKVEENQSGAPEDEQGSKTKEDDETSDDKPDEKEKVGADLEKEAEEVTTEKTDKAEEDEEEEEGDETEEAEADKEKAEDEDTADKGSDDEEVGNLQLAWEMLEVAKVIYKRKESKEDQLMAAQTHLKLGEVSAESGNYTQALEDFQECLKLQLKHLEPDSRCLAETYYQLGLTYSLNSQYKQAIDELNSSISAIKSRLDKLQELINKAEGPEALPDERKEMEELKALLPEIQEKVEDASEGLKTANTDAEAVKDVLAGSSSAESGDQQISTKVNGTQSGSPTAVSNISHLVRKKRKPEESPVKEAVLKKVKQDEAQTDGVEESQTKCHINSMEVESK